MKRNPLLLLRILLVLAVIVPFILSSCSSQETTDQTTATTNSPAPKPIELSIAHMEPPTHFLHALLEDWAKKVEEQTNGKVHFTIYPAGTLCAPPELYDSVIGGVADIGVGTAGYTPARFPLNAFCTDYMHRTSSAVAGTKIYNELWENNEALQKEFDGTKVIWLAVHTPGNLHTKFPCNTLEDISGKDVRFPGTLSPLADVLGLVPVSMPMSETFVSLEKGIVDGCVAPLSELEGHRFAEVTEYTMMLNFYVGSRYTIMNIDTWNSLPADVQKVIEDLGAWGSTEEAKGWDASCEEGVEFAEGYGHIFVYPTDDVMNEIYELLAEADDDMAASLDAQGLPGSEILNELNRIEDKYQ